MKRELICIICPMGCQLVVEETASGLSISGNTCARGAKYAEQEVTCPMRTVTSLMAVDGASMPLCPVKTRAQVPKASIPAVLEALKAARATAPIRIGDVLLPNAAGTGVDIVATANRL